MRALIHSTFGAPGEVLEVQDRPLPEPGPGQARVRTRLATIHNHDLLTVSGVGPKVALAVVSGSPAAELRKAIALGDHARFQAIPGIGKKTAERIVLELKEKLGSEDVVVLPATTPGSGSSHVTARDALVGLGYSVAEAEQALARVDPDLPAEERVRLALRSAA